MEKTESSCAILRSLNLDDIKEVLSEASHQEGAGRPPRKSLLALESFHFLQISIERRRDS